MAEFGAAAADDVSSEALLAAAVNWLESDLPKQPGAITRTSGTFAVNYQPVVRALWTALEVFGLPAYRPDYGDWISKRSAGMRDGTAIDHEDLNTLQLYVQALHRGERWCDGYWKDCIVGGGFLRAMRLLRKLHMNGSA